MANAVGFAQLGHLVTGYDVLPERVRALQAGVTPYREAGIAEALRREVASGHLCFFEELEQAVAGAEFIIVAVGTPCRHDGSADVSAVHDVIDALVDLGVRGATVIIRSTVPAGTTERIAERLAPKMQVVFAPEFLREGHALQDFLNSDRVVIGVGLDDDPAPAEALLSPLGPTCVTYFREAELIKGCSNAYLALKISYANEIANLCDAVGADALAVLDGMGADRRIGKEFLAPGIGFGGPCFEKDLKSMDALADSVGSRNELFRTTLEINKRQTRRVVEIAEQELGDLYGTRVGIWGMTFKAGTSDLRDSLACRIVRDFLERGCIVTAYDPSLSHGDHPELPAIAIATSALAAAEADVLVVLTEWPEFQTIDPSQLAARLSRKLVIDGRNVLDPGRISAAGLRYRGIGRRAEPDLVAELARAV